MQSTNINYLLPVALLPPLLNSLTHTLHLSIINDSMPAELGSGLLVCTKESIYSSVIFLWTGSDPDVVFPDILITLFNRNWEFSNIMTAVGNYSVMRSILKVQPCFIWGPNATHFCCFDSGAFTSSSRLPNITLFITWFQSNELLNRCWVNKHTKRLNDVRSDCQVIRVTPKFCFFFVWRWITKSQVDDMM